MTAKTHQRTTFGAWLENQLMRREWNQSDFARRVGIRPGVVSHWVRNERLPSPASIEKIADALFVDVDEVLAIAGHRPRLPMEQLDKFHALADPYARKLDWDDPEVQLAIVSALQQQIRVKEIREGTRSVEQFFEPVDLDDEEER